MIEIEKKFLLTDVQEEALLAGATLQSEKVVTDSYFDTPDYRLTLQDFWFRERDGVFELKAPLKSSDGSQGSTNRYREITNLDEIRSELQLDGGDFETALSVAGITKFITCHSSRRSYEKDGFHIDIDAVTYDESDFEFAIAEIELLIADESEADMAEAHIVEFAQRFGLTTDKKVLGKVAAYLKRERPEHYEALVAAGVF